MAQAETKADPVRERETQTKMREQCACIRRMAKVFIQAAPYKSMIVPDQNLAGKVFAEGIDGYPSDADSGEQQPKTQGRGETSASLDTTDAGKTENHAEQFDSTGSIPKPGRLPIPILCGRDFVSTQVRIFNQQP